MKRVFGDRNAELALCGAALIDNGVLDAVDIAPEQFQDLALRRMWAVMLDLRREGVAIDEITLPARAGLPEHIHPTLMAECALATPTARNAEHYAEIIREHALTRQVLGALADVQGQYEAGHASGKELLDVALAAFTGIDVGRPGVTLSMRDVIKARLRELDEITQAAQQGVVPLMGVTTGIAPLDEVMNGWPLGLVSIVAARPGMGKSAFMLHAAASASLVGHGVHVFSFEDPRAAYADRALSQASRVPGATFRSARLSRREFEDFTEGARRLLRQENWLYEDVAALSAQDIVRAVRRARVKNKTKLVIVDYLQLVRRPRRYESVHDAIAQNLEVLADAAKQDDIAYLIASQLNRGVEKRQDRRPQLSDLRDCGTIEERAKVILGLYRGAHHGPPQKGVDYEPGEGPPSELDWEQRLDVLVLKYSQGESGTYVRCKWDGPATRIYT